MQCSYCGSKWQSQDGKVKLVCPFCGKPLFTTEEPLTSLDIVLSRLTAHYGPEILLERQEVLLYLAACLPGGKREWNFLNIAYTAGIVNLIFRSCNLPSIRQRNTLEQAIASLEDDYGIATEWAQYVVMSVATSLGINSASDKLGAGLRVLAESGDSSAQFKLAVGYFNDAHTEANINSYMYWIEKSIKSGCCEASAHLGQYLFNSATTDEDRAKGEALLRSAAQAGNADAICFIAGHITSFPLEHEWIKGQVCLFEENKEKLSAKQLLNLSFYYDSKAVDVRDIDKAINSAKDAYSADRSVAWKRYYELLQQRGSREDSIVAINLLKEVAGDTNVEAMLILAEKCAQVAKSDADMVTALYWYKMAADAGSVDAQLYLGQAFEHGHFVKHDLDQAIYWYECAAVNGSHIAGEKVRYKSPSCIKQTITLTLEDDSELTCKVVKCFNYEGKDYLIIVDPGTNEIVPLLYREIDETGNYDVELLDEQDEARVLQAFKGAR